MPSTEELLDAKRILSARLLHAGARGGVVGLAHAVRVHDAVAAADRNVHAVGIGRKITDYGLTQTRCVRLYVVQKLAESLLPPRDRLPREIDGIPTDVIESPPAFLLAKAKPARRAATSADCTAKRRKKQRPVIAGISSGHRDITAGTLGYFCRSTHSGDDPAQVCVLSNNHVYANVNLGAKGDDLFQPGPADGGTEADHFANLLRFVPIKLNGTTPNRVDAAIGTLRRGVKHKLSLCKIGKITGTDRAVEDMVVRKHGRTSGYTEGVVTDESYDALVGMDHNDSSLVGLFEGQMRIERRGSYPYFGLGGDSGSLVVAKQARKAVGLYFAGPDSGVYGIANHIRDVLSELEIELL